MRLPALAMASLMSCAAPWLAHASSATDDRIDISLDGSTLSDSQQKHGGGGISLGWLHNFDANSVLGVAAEHQGIANSHWTFGSVNGSMALGTDNARYNFNGEAHEGGGQDGVHSFRYSIEAVGVVGTYFHKFSAQLEDRRIDVEATHGNLPKVGLSYVWSSRLMTTATYQHSVSGNLGTRLTGARIDEYGAVANFFAGVAFGQASPVIVLNLPVQFSSTLIAGKQLHEGYIGASRPVPRLRGDLSLVADYQNLSGIKHATLTLNYLFHVGTTGTSR